MLEDADLDAAVAGGIVTQVQATALREIAARRERDRVNALGPEERFHFMRGFNDFFFAVGVVLLVLGLAFFVGQHPIGRAFIAAVVWWLAEVLVARLRLVLPGILLAAAFVGFVVQAVPLESWLAVTWRPASSMLGTIGTSQGAALLVVLKALIGTAAAGVFYWRFKFPLFALLPLGASLVAVVLAAMSQLLPAAGVWDALVLLACALAVFGAAMAFDISDRERLTRRADCAFWLHLLAAPLIVHSLIRLISPWFGATSSRVSSMTPTLAVGIVLIFVALAIVAILIDRRALLVSGLAYLGSAVAYAIGGTTAVSGGVSLAVAGTFLLLGALVLVLGVGWAPLRRIVLPLLSAPIANRLPPVPVRT